jgi:hypothetical protein
MRTVLLAGLIAGVVAVAGDALSVVAQTPKDTPKEPAKSAVKDTAAAEFTRTKLLKTKVACDFTNTRLGEILKELAAQVDMKSDQPVMWAYGPGFPFVQKVTFKVKDKPLDVVLDQLLSKAGGGLGYFVVSKDGDKYDGWVRLTSNGERGFEPPPATAEEEATAATRLALAKKLIDAGKPNSAKPLLEVILKNYPTSKAATEARELLAKIEK